MFEFDTGIIFWNTVAFAILVFLMYKWALPPLLKLLKEREKTISDALLTAQTQQQQAQETLSSARQKITEAGQTAQMILQQAQAEGEKLKKDMSESGRKEADYYLTRAKEDLNRQKNEILSEIKTQTAELVVEVAGKVLGKKMDKVEDARLIDESLKAWKK
jgi:F-type H+-transporting ATPase subunit b